MNLKQLLCSVLIGSCLFTSGCSLIPTDGTITYGLYYEDQDISGYSRDAVSTLIHTEASNNKTITITIPNQGTRQVKVKDLGITLDTDSTESNIFTYGYEDDLKTLILHRITAFIYKVHINPVYKLDEVTAKAYFTELAKQIDVSGHDALLTVENGQVKMTPSKEGKRVDIDETIKQLKAQLEENNFDNIEEFRTNRILLPDLRQYSRLLAKNQIKGLLKKYEYSTCLELLKRDIFQENSKLNGLLNFANDRRHLKGLKSNGKLKSLNDKKFDKFWKDLEVHRNNPFNLVATIAAYSDEGEEYLNQLKEYLQNNILFLNDFFKEYIPEITPNIPQATYLVWLDCRKLCEKFGFNQKQLEEFMLTKAKLGLNEGRVYQKGLEGFMRLNAACPRVVLEKALNQLKDAILNEKSK